MPQRHRPELSDSVSGEALVTYRRLPRTFRPGRTCAMPGCPTVLSIYNSGKHCSAHQAGRWRTPVPAPAGGEAPLSSASPAAPAAADEGVVVDRARPRARVLVDPGGEVTRRAS
jgi:hypothetical protein